MDEKMFLRSKAAKKLRTSTGMLKELEKRGLITPPRDERSRPRYTLPFIEEIRPVVQRYTQDGVPAESNILIPHLETVETVQAPVQVPPEEDEQSEEDAEFDERMMSAIGGLLGQAAAYRSQTIAELTFDMAGHYEGKPWLPDGVRDLVNYWAEYKEADAEEMWSDLMEIMLAKAVAEQKQQWQPQARGFAGLPASAYPARGKGGKRGGGGPKGGLPLQPFAAPPFPYGYSQQRVPMSAPVQAKYDALMIRQMEAEARRQEKRIEQDEKEEEARDRLELAERQAKAHADEQQRLADQQQAAQQQMLWWDGRRRGFW